MMSRQPIGAQVSIKWLDQLEFEPIEGAYISFGEYDEDNETDSYGIPDECVLYYANGVDELKRLMDVDKTPSDFIVVEYNLTFASEVV
jgi:hypothetical protein